LLQLLKLNRNRSTTILSDDWSPADSYPFWTVQDFTDQTHLGNATCVDIGRFQLNGRFSHVQVVHRKLVKMWPDVVSTPDDYDVYTDVLAVIKANGSSLRMPNVPIRAAQTSLRRWVGIFQEVFRWLYSAIPDARLAELDAEQKTILIQFQRTLMFTTYNAIETSINIWEDRARGRPLKTLGPGDDPALLAWATDLLSVNITAYHPCVDRFRIDGDGRSAHWVGSHGGMHTLDIMKMHAISAASGQTNAHYVCHPVFPNHVRETFFYYDLMASNPRNFFQYYFFVDVDLDPDKIRQFCALHTAMNPGHLRADYQQMVDNWAAQLLRRYLLADPSVRKEEAKRATLGQMREAMRITLRLFESRSGNDFGRTAEAVRRDDEPVNRLDPDLLPMLAWKYGRVFVDIWRAVVKRHSRQQQERSRANA
jgi:hypothetical protein